MEKIKICQVCSDEASGFNYDVLTCKSCKVFFHRNSSKLEKLRCYKVDQKCEINIETRKYCSKCRLEKCFAIGMKRKEIDELDDEEKVEPSCRIEIDKFMETNISRKLSELPETSQLHNEIESDYALFVDKVIRKKRYATDLTVFEREQIVTAQNAHRVFNDETTVQIVRPTSKIVEIFKIPDIYFRWTVKFCKRFPAFTYLNSVDQFKILKPFCFDVLAIHFGFIFDKARNGYPMFENDSGNHAIFVIYNVSKEKQYQHLIDFNLNFWSSIREEMENDPIIRDLVSAQLLFKPRDGLSCIEFIRYNYAFYSRLIKRYFEHKYKHIYVAERKFAKLMRVLANLEQVKENEQKLFNEFDLKHIPQLVGEVYNFL